MGDSTDLLSSLVSGDSLPSYSDTRSNPSKRSTNRKKLPLPSASNGSTGLLGKHFLIQIHMEEGDLYALRCVFALDRYFQSHYWSTPLFPAVLFKSERATGG